MANTRSAHSRVKGLTQQMFDLANIEHSTLKRLSVMDKYLAEFDTDLDVKIKGSTCIRRNVCTLKEDQVREHYRERPYVAPTTPMAHVDRADPDDPFPRPTRRPRHDDPYGAVQHLLSRFVYKRGNTNGVARQTQAGNTGGNAGGQGGAPPARECTYSSFMKCNPTSFRGNEGTVELCRWFEKTESVFQISEMLQRETRNGSESKKRESGGYTYVACWKSIIKGGRNNFFQNVVLNEAVRNGSDP
ncbi:hypothetical protein Tco_0013400 [Tanacetum coccineum]